MQLKDFKKLVQFCRSAGVLTYKGECSNGVVEFTLSPEDPKLERKNAKKLSKIEDKIEERLDQISDEDLLLYSSQGVSPEKDV